MLLARPLNCAPPLPRVGVEQWDPPLVPAANSVNVNTESSCFHAANLQLNSAPLLHCSTVRAPEPRSGGTSSTAPPEATVDKFQAAMTGESHRGPAVCSFPTPRRHSVGDWPAGERGAVGVNLLWCVFLCRSGARARYRVSAGPRHGILPLQPLPCRCCSAVSRWRHHHR